MMKTLQGGMIVSSGVIPVVVYLGEIGSVIAATLASVHYQKLLRAKLVHNQAHTYVYNKKNNYETYWSTLFCLWYINWGGTPNYY